MPHEVRAKALTGVSFRRRWSSLTWEVAALWCVTLVTLCLLSAAAFDSIYLNELESMRRERYTVLLTDIREEVEADLRIGFDLRQNRRGAQANIDELIHQNPSLRSIEVFNLQGKLMASTDRGTVGETVPQAWLAGALAATPGATWVVEGVDETVFGVPIKGLFGEAAGEIAVTYAPQPVGWSQNLVSEPRQWGGLFAVLLAGVLLTLGLVKRYARAVEIQEHIFERAQDTSLLQGESAFLAGQQTLQSVESRLRAAQSELDARK